jgi:hypothetical protein
MHYEAKSMTTPAAHRKTAINSTRNYCQKRNFRCSNLGIVCTSRINAVGMAARISGKAIKATTDIPLVSVTPRCLDMTAHVIAQWLLPVYANTGIDIRVSAFGK